MSTASCSHLPLFLFLSTLLFPFHPLVPFPPSGCLSTLLFLCPTFGSPWPTSGCPLPFWFPFPSGPPAPSHPAVLVDDVPESLHCDVGAAAHEHHRLPAEPPGILQERPDHHPRRTLDHLKQEHQSVVRRATKVHRATHPAGKVVLLPLDDLKPEHQSVVRREASDRL